MLEGLQVMSMKVEIHERGCGAGAENLKAVWSKTNFFNSATCQSLWLLAPRRSED